MCMSKAETGPSSIGPSRIHVYLSIHANLAAILNWSVLQLRVWACVVQMSFTVFHMAANLKSNMASKRNIFHFGFHPKKFHHFFFFIQGAKFYTLLK